VVSVISGEDFVYAFSQALSTE